MRNSTIKKVRIRGLFSTEQGFDIPINNDVIILIGENGIGKTTALNILYYTLTKKFYKLRSFLFSEILIEFTSGRKIHFLKEDLTYYDDNYNSSEEKRIMYIVDELSQSNFYEEIMNWYNAEDRDIKDIMEFISENRIHSIFRKHPTRYVRKAILTLVEGNNSKIVDIREIIDKELNDLKILYFPTYRRIEEDLRNLGLDDDNIKIKEKDSKLIQFGMRDVKERFYMIKAEIESLSSKGLARISSEILSQLIKGTPQINKAIIESIKPEDIQIILSRVGSALSESDKQSVIELATSNKIHNSDKMLIYFLEKLINVYDLQRDLDENINKFVKVCNNYLKYSNKAIIYDESEVEFFIVIKGVKTKLSDLLSKLSSGEKQIISLFSKIYLTKNEHYFVLFDEPELSLSIEWQRMLLPDIMGSGKCDFLFAVTHSPFIFENELDPYAIGLNEFII